MPKVSIYLASFLTLSMLFSCKTSSKHFISKGKAEILKIDSTNNLIVFTIRENSLSNLIVAEKKNILICKPFKRFLILDSIHSAINIKDGSKEIGIGFNSLTIDKVKVKNAGVLARVITNCFAFSD